MDKFTGILPIIVLQLLLSLARLQTSTFINTATFSIIEMKLESTVDGPVLKKKVSTVTPQPTTIIFNFMTMMAYDDE